MILDHTQASIVKRQYDKVVPTLRAKILEMGGVVNDAAFPDVMEAYNSTMRLKNPFTEEYFGAESILDSWRKVRESAGKSNDPIQKEYFSNFENFLLRCEATYDISLMNRLNIQLDPVSALFLIIAVSIESDNEAYNYTNAPHEWIDHNLGYLSKVGFSSNYFYPLLQEARKGYERMEDISLSDDEITSLARAIIIMQELVKGGELSPKPIAETQLMALENNNQAAETFPGYGNLKNDAVQERTLLRSEYIKENLSSDDVFPFTQLHRIQSGGNVLLEFMPLTIDDATGKVLFERQMLVQALDQIAVKRGYFITYVEKEPQVLPEIAHLVSYYKLPDTYVLRQELVDSGSESAQILFKFKGSETFQFNYSVTCPNVFTLVGDKYLDVFPELADKMLTKHRSVKAGGPDFSRLVQSYLYPLMDYMKEKNLGTPLSSLVAQWSHPDKLRSMFTDYMVVSAGEQIAQYVDHSLDLTALKEFKDVLEEEGYDILTASDDKKGFDNFTPVFILWAFHCCFMSIPFAKSDENNLAFRAMAKQLLFPVVIAPEGIIIYSSIIPSGAGLTSAYGTYDSNVSALTIADRVIIDYVNSKSGGSDDESDDVEENGKDGSSEPNAGSNTDDEKDDGVEELTDSVEQGEDAVVGEDDPHEN